MAVTVTLATMKTAVGYLLDDEGEVLYKAARKTAHLNRAVNFVQIVLSQWGGKRLVASTDITLVAGTKTYAHAKEIMQVEKVVIVDDDGVFHTLQPIPFVDADRYQSATATTGLPTRYYVYGALMGFAPEPAEAGTVRVFYTSQATDLSADGDALTLPPWCRDMIETYAASRLASTKGDYTTKNMLEADYAKIVREMEYQIATWQRQEPLQAHDRWADEFSLGL